MKLCALYYCYKVVQTKTTYMISDDRMNINNVVFVVVAQCNVESLILVGIG